MSRLIVKNLPNNITVDKLRELFNQKGEITDVQLKYTKEGKFRNFGFIGFKTEEQASEAQIFFNGSCIKTTKISVETCVSIGHSSKPQAWSKYAADSSAYRKLHNIVNDNPPPPITTDGDTSKSRSSKKDNVLLEEIEKRKDDPMFMEFLEVHASKLDKAVWSNDAVTNKSKKEKKQTEDADKDEVTVSSSEKKTDVADEEPDIKKKTKKKKKDKVSEQTISDLEYLNSLKNKKEDLKSNSDDETTKDAKPAKQKKEKKDWRNRVLFFVKMQGMPFSCKKKDVKEFFRPLVPFTIRIPRFQSKLTRGFCYIGFRSEDERKKAIFKNKCFLGGHRVIVNYYENKNNIPGDEEEDGNDGSNNNYKHKAQEESIKNEESIAESGLIYVRNLPYITTEDEIQTLFEKYGPVSEVNIPVDRITHQSKGFAHVTFMMPEHAVKAYGELDGTVFSGRMLHLLPGKPRQPVDPDEEGLTYKEKKARKQKLQANSAHNWNTLFLGANAVADAVANTYNTTKERLLEGNSKTSAAVRLALGETQLVAGTKKFLEENGVCLDAFNQPSIKRSKKVILVKNMPAQTTRDEVVALFEPFGLVARLVLPPHGITALVEFVEPSEARRAFTKLAYSKFKYLPLYLEWAPDNVFRETPAENVEVKSKQITANDSKKLEDGNDLEKRVNENIVTEKDSNRKEKAELQHEDEEDAPEVGTILFVKGLHFDSREENVRRHFECCGKLFSVTVAMKNDPRNPGKKLSMGYGFVQYFTKHATEKALKTLQLSMLDGKQIELKRSERTQSEDVRTAKKETEIRKQTGVKILVRNVPFQANQREIQEIFSTFGEIKALRMPKKLQPGESRHRGFCFVEYYNKGDAKSAYEALCQSTHLYGRRLVLEWAKPEDDTEMLDSIRKRTAESYHAELPGGKKTKKALLQPEGMEEDED